MKTASPTTTFLVTTALALTAALAPASRADYWLTINPDGTVTRTEIAAPPQADKEKDTEKKPEQATDKTSDKIGDKTAGQTSITTAAAAARASRIPATSYSKGMGMISPGPGTAAARGQLDANGQLINSRQRDEGRLSTRTNSYGQYYPAHPGYYPGYPSYPAYPSYPSYPAYPGYQQPYNHQLPTPLGSSSPWITSIPGPLIVQTPGYYCPPPAYGPAYPPPVVHYPQPYQTYPAYPSYPGYNPYPYGYPGTGSVYSNSTYGSFSLGSGGARVSIGGSRQTTTTTTTTSGIFGR